MAETKRVYVYKEEGLIDSYKVYPPVTILKKNDDIELVNCTDDEALWELPAGLLDAAASNVSVAGRAKKNKTANEPGPRAAEYKVHVDGKRAHAHSDPVIIIDP